MSITGAFDVYILYILLWVAFNVRAGMAQPCALT